MSRYRKIDVRIHNDAAFRALSRPQPNGQSLFLFCLTGPFTTNLPGLFSAGEAAMAERLGWSLEAFREAFREASGEAFEKGCRKALVKADWDAHLVWVPNAIKYNIPESPNVIKGWAVLWDELPECGLKTQAHQHFEAFLEAFSKAFAKAFLEACPKPSGKPSPKPSPNQEQEQEQEQEKESRVEKAPASRPSQDSATSEWIVEQWNQIPGIVRFEDKIQGPILKRIESALRERKSKAWWSEYFAKVTPIDWLCGRNQEGWAATLDWIMGPRNISKVLAGFYANRRVPAASTNGAQGKPTTCNYHPEHDCSLPITSTVGSQRTCIWHSHLAKHPELNETRDVFMRYWPTVHQAVRKNLSPDQAWSKTNSSRLLAAVE